MYNINNVDAMRNPAQNDPQNPAATWHFSVATQLRIWLGQEFTTTGAGQEGC